MKCLTWIILQFTVITKAKRQNYKSRQFTTFSLVWEIVWSIKEIPFDEMCQFVQKPNLVMFTKSAWTTERTICWFVVPENTYNSQQPKGKLCFIQCQLVQGFSEWVYESINFRCESNWDSSLEDRLSYFHIVPIGLSKKRTDVLSEGIRKTVEKITEDSFESSNPIWTHNTADSLYHYRKDKSAWKDFSIW